MPVRRTETFVANPTAFGIAPLCETGSLLTWMNAVFMLR
jgi:hypothetical protein